ncbi:MAG: zinc metallopeptidase [Prevotellaceae bacterium]|jgi:Zn-dependent membrane protease YugP|nr:zinc metallopeptidase [Prevotellaceae bacterium]
MYWIIFIGTALASWLVSANLKHKFKKYSQIPLPLSGREVAEKMLHENGLDDVKVTSTSGQLTDHYNPLTKTVNLSESVYNSYNVAAAAVAAHECGHAVQHARAYAPLKMRSVLVPIVNFSSKWVMWVILAGLFLFNPKAPYMGQTLLLVGIGLFALTTLFSFITLPVEIDASRRAVAWLRESGVTNVNTNSAAEGALKAAAYTYVVAALGSLATLLYYIMIYMGRRD